MKFIMEFEFNGKMSKLQMVNLCSYLEHMLWIYDGQDMPGLEIIDSEVKE